MERDDPETRKILHRERSQLLEQYDEWFEIPGLFLGLAWLVLLIIDLVSGLNPFFNDIFNLIWILFIADFFLRLILTPDKTAYIKNNWLTILSLALPALRLLRFVRLLRILQATRGLRLVRIVTSLNRGVRSLRFTFIRRGFGYVLAVTLLVTLVGAAGMFTFEADSTGERAFQTYADALFWTAMVMTTLGGNYTPITPEGRLLAVILAIYAFTVFGYVAATLASHFIGQDAHPGPTSVQGLDELKAEIQALRREIQSLSGSSPAQEAAPHPEPPPVSEERGKNSVSS